MWKVGGIKIESAAGRRFFLPKRHENSWKREIFCKSLRTRKFSMGKFFGASTHGIVTHSGFRKCIWKVGTTNFWPCFACPKLGDAGEMRVASKNRVVLRKTFRPQFSDFRLAIESAVFWYIRNIADSISRLKSENCGRKVLGNTYLFLLATRISPASPNFGQAKHGQNGPAATDCQQCIFYPICGHHFTHRTHTDISFRFRPGGRRLKNFRFSRIFMSLW